VVIDFDAKQSIVDFNSVNKESIALMVNQKKFRLILNIISKRISATVREGIVIFNNDLSERLLDIPEVQLLGKRI